LKTDLSPNYIHKIDETVILWFQKSNRYIVVSENIYKLISLYLNVEDKLSYLRTLHETFKIDTDHCESIFTEISNFLKDANTLSHIDHATIGKHEIPKNNIERTYNFDDKIVRIHFQSHLIESLIHPQIAHHLTDEIVDFDVEFNIFKVADNLLLYKNKHYVGSYTTSAFHLLQGKFALELTNEIHNTQLEKWVATFHASTVTNTSEAIMIIGDSGNGKSTLSALLMANGFHLLADDFSPFYENSNIYSYPAAISIKKGAFKVIEPYLKGFNTLKTHTNGPKKVNLKYVPPIIGFNASEKSFPCHKIVAVKFDATKPSELKEVSQ